MPLVARAEETDQVVRHEPGLAYAPNISWLLPDLPFAERPGALAEAGFGALEFGFPSHADIPALEAARQEQGLEIVLFNQDVPRWDEENRGYLVDRRRGDEFRRTLDEALEIARRLSAKKIMLPAGVEIPGLDRAAQHECMVRRLAEAAPLAASAGVLLTIEVLNPGDNPGYFLTSSKEALESVRQVNHPSVRFQLDTYHLTRLEGSVAETLAANAEWIGHIQFADEPGRHEPGSGAIDFPAVLRAARDSGYGGYIGLEYVPQSGGPETLDWVPGEMRRLSASSRRRG
jgi:hydroxypyruvate isomerase